MSPLKKKKFMVDDPDVIVMLIFTCEGKDLDGERVILPRERKTDEWKRISLSRRIIRNDLCLVVSSLIKVLSSHENKN